VKRLIGMRMSSSPRRWALPEVVAVTHFVTWPKACFVVAAMICILGYRLLAERSRRATLVALCQHAPEGTVIVQGSGPGGPQVRVEIGDGPRMIRPTATRVSSVSPPVQPGRRLGRL
jgi:hypothetical protein